MRISHQESSLMCATSRHRHVAMPMRTVPGSLGSCQLLVGQLLCVVHILLRTSEAPPATPGSARSVVVRATT